MRMILVTLQIFIYVFQTSLANCNRGIVLTLGREVMRIICVYGTQSGRPDTKKVCFCDEMASEWDLGNSSEIIPSLGDFNGQVGKYAESFEGIHGENGIEKRNAEGRLVVSNLFHFCFSTQKNSTIGYKQ